jgi:hypothetical protein
MDNENQQSEVMDTLREIHHTQSQLLAAVEALSDRLGRVEATTKTSPAVASAGNKSVENTELKQTNETPALSSDAIIRAPLEEGASLSAPAPASPSQRSALTSRIILTTYPKQIGINPLPMKWGNFDPLKRGPVVVSRSPNTVRRRNAIGAHGGSYSIYYALAVASKELNADHRSVLAHFTLESANSCLPRPDFTNTEPAAQIGPFPQWGDPDKIVAMDPYGHLAPWVFKDIIEQDNVDIRPTIAITKAHMKLPELEESVKSGRLVPDGKVCLNELGELAVTKFAVEPVLCTL